MEAAVVMPLIIVSVITCVLVIMFFYSQMSERSSMHIMLRSEAGQLTGKTKYIHESGFDMGEQGEMYVRQNGIDTVVYGKKYLMMPHKGILARKGAAVIQGNYYAMDAVRFVRYCSIIEDLRNEQ